MPFAPRLSDGAPAFYGASVACALHTFALRHFFDQFGEFGKGDSC
jgi:hypothetical protein